MAAADSHRAEAGVKGEHADPTGESRRAQLRPGRYTNALQHRRAVEHADVG
jgi:hypothetical protein